MTHALVFDIKYPTYSVFSCHISIISSVKHVSTCGPIELHFLDGNGPGTRHGFPSGPVVLVPDQGVDDAAGVHHADVGTVGQKYLPRGGNRNT